MAGYDLKLRLWRGDASGGELVDYVVPVDEGMVVLDAVHRLQATQASDLAVRWNCKAGKCGSCSAEINGKPRLMCMTRLNLFDPADTVTVTPMRTWPIIRDLVTDVTFNYAVAQKVPAFSPKPREKDGTYRMQQSEVDRLQEFRKCIECFMCQNVCHVIRDHTENLPAFSGPRFFIRLAELDMHPLDTKDRRRLSQEDMGLGFCNITKCCTEVCPENIKITDNGIIPLKERAVDAKYDPVVWITDRLSPTRRQRQPVGPAETSGWVGTDPRPYDVPSVHERVSGSGSVSAAPPHRAPAAVTSVSPTRVPAAKAPAPAAPAVTDNTSATDPTRARKAAYYVGGAAGLAAAFVLWRRARRRG